MRAERIRCLKCESENITAISAEKNYILCKDCGHKSYPADYETKYSK